MITFIMKRWNNAYWLANHWFLFFEKVLLIWPLYFLNSFPFFRMSNANYFSSIRYNRGTLYSQVIHSATFQLPCKRKCRIDFLEIRSRSITELSSWYRREASQKLFYFSYRSPRLDDDITMKATTGGISVATCSR